MTVSDQIVQVIDSLAEKVGIVVDWGGANVMPYLQDLVMRISYMEICKNIIMIILGLFSAFITKKMINVCVKLCEEDEEYSEFAVAIIFGIIIGACTAFVLILLGIIGLPSAIFLPEVTAYKYMLEAIK